MKKIGAWDQGEVLQHPHAQQNISEVDICVDLLQRKLCPVNLTPLLYYKELCAGNYRRLYYECLLCHCEAEFVGEKLKSNSVGRTMETISAMVAEAERMSEPDIISDSSTNHSVSI